MADRPSSAGCSDSARSVQAGCGQVKALRNRSQDVRIRLFTRPVRRHVYFADVAQWRKRAQTGRCVWALSGHAPQSSRARGDDLSVKTYTYPSLSAGPIRVLWLARRPRLCIESQRQPGSRRGGVQLIVFNTLFVEWRPRSSRSKLAA